MHGRDAWKVFEIGNGIKTIRGFCFCKNPTLPPWEMLELLEGNNSLFPFPLTLFFYPNLDPDVMRVVSTLLQNTFFHRVFWVYAHNNGSLGE